MASSRLAKISTRSAKYFENNICVSYVRSEKPWWLFQKIDYEKWLTIVSNENSSNVWIWQFENLTIEIGQKSHMQI